MYVEIMQFILFIEDYEGVWYCLIEVLNWVFVLLEIVVVFIFSVVCLIIVKCVFDLIVLDLSLFDGFGEDFFLEIFVIYFKVYVVIVSIYDEGVYLVGVLVNGVQGYFLKD